MAVPKNNAEHCISSFVIRFYKRQDQPSWRIKVTHVQDKDEISFTSIQEAIDFMLLRLKE